MSGNTNGTRRGPAAMTDEHKQALAIGRTESRAVKAYLEAIAAAKPKRGRKRTVESVRKRLTTIEAEITEAAPLNRLSLVQERMDLSEELETMAKVADISELEAAFITVAGSYGERKGISHGAWRELGVDSSVLKQAGITR